MIQTLFLSISIHLATRLVNTFLGHLEPIVNKNNRMASLLSSKWRLAISSRLVELILETTVEMRLSASTDRFEKGRARAPLQFD